VALALHPHTSSKSPESITSKGASLSPQSATLPSPSSSSSTPQLNDYLIFLSRINANLSIVAEAVQDILLLYDVWGHYQPSASTGGSSLSSSSSKENKATAQEMEIGQLMIRMREERDRNMAHPAHAGAIAPVTKFPVATIDRNSYHNTVAEGSGGSGSTSVGSVGRGKKPVDRRVRNIVSGR